MAATTLLEELDKRWRQTCSVVLKGEVGPLPDFEQWLSERADPIYHAQSSLSGKEVSFSSSSYCEGSKRVALGEVSFEKKQAALPVDDLKDIDSLISSLQERFSYAGDIVLGNCSSVERSTNVSDSHFIYGSSRIGDSKYIAYSSMARLCDHVFGTAAPGESSFLIRCNDTYRLSRALELWMTSNSNDCYYVFALNNCTDCMFSFNLRGKHHCIGNAELPRDKYLSLKESLLEQMRGELVQKKRLPSLMDIIAKSPDESKEAKRLVQGRLGKKESEEKSVAPMEKAFQRTTKLLLGTELSGLKEHSGWLTSRTPKGEMRKSALSGKEIFVGNYAKYMTVPKSRTVLEEEALCLVDAAPKPQGLERIMLENAHEYIGISAFLSLDYHDGTNKNVKNCMAYAYSSNALYCAPCVQVKDSAYNWWPRSSEHLFGCGMVFDSSFCIHCYQSVKLNRCFEVDSSRDCADCYFCHNCENVQNGIFCFNVKNLKYAVGNVEVGREKYLQAKGALLRRIVPALESGRAPGLDIFSIACIGRKKS
ncbi:MAG: hypothetical protein NTX79_00705 [Candidatus Micrarchaeota archaeon]|nr:hypothetical protein [Candidatus Micrarchaeota archaeon]